MKRINFFVKSMYGGGAQRVIIVLAEEFIRLGYEINIIAMYDECDYPINDKISIIPIYINSEKLNIENNYVNLDSVYDRCKFNSNDVFIACSSSATLYEYALYFWEKCNATDKPKIIAALTNDPQNSPSSRSGQMKRDAMFEKVECVDGRFVFQTKEAMEYFSESIQKRGTIINNPITQNIPLPFSGIRKKAIVTAGRLNFQKNFPLLIKAFFNVLKKHKDFELHIYGKGEEENKLRELAKNDRRIIFKGFSTNLLDEIKDATCFVLPSNFEGVSNVMLESLCLGIPTICTDCPVYGARHFIDNGISGLIIPMEDPYAMTEAINRIIEDPEFGRFLSENATKVSERLNVEEICQQYIDLF